MNLSQEFLEQVKQANNIVSVAGRYMKLSQKGRQHWGLCPFHNEKTPSFAINDHAQFYHCFGCGASGNVINLVRQLENVDFMGAVELLAKWAGMKMPETVNDPQYEAKTKKKQKVLEILEETRDFYCKSLTAAAVDYLHGRGITDELIELFNIGSSPDYDSVITHLKKKGYCEQDILDAGVAAKSDKGRVYDAMGGRVTFAIFDVYGNCIGFTGRILPQNEKEAEAKGAHIAKYRNTAQTIVFDKGSIVYGVDVLKKNKLANFIESLIVVEGNVDVVSLVGAGFKNTVACMGTAMTQFHARIFKRFSNQIYICFDGDAAGQKAALRSLDILDAEGLSVRVIELPLDSDPDGFIAKNGKDAFQALVDGALPLVDFKLDHVAKNSNLKDNLGKTEYLKNAVEVLKSIGNMAEIELYAPKVANVAGVSVDSILRSVGVITKRAAVVKVDAPVKPLKTATAYQNALDFIVASKLHKKKYAEAPLDFEIANKLYAQIADTYVRDIFELLNPEELESVNHLVAYDFSASEDTLAKQYQDSVQYLLKNHLQSRRDQLQEAFYNTDDMEAKKEIVNEMQKINQKIKRLKDD